METKTIPNAVFFPFIVIPSKENTGTSLQFLPEGPAPRFFEPSFQSNRHEIPCLFGEIPGRIQKRTEKLSQVLPSFTGTGTINP